MKLSIPTPCREANWQQMSDAEAGRFCGRCEKTVIDFTGLTDAEIYRLISRQQGRICGRLDPTQLNRTIHTSQQNTSHKRFHRLLAGLLFFGIAKNTEATNKTNTATELNYIGHDRQIKNTVRSPVAEDTAIVFIKGTVISRETKEAIPYAAVFVKGEHINMGTSADKNGNFSLKLPARFRNKKFTLCAAAVGYETVEHRIKKRKIRGPATFCSRCARSHTWRNRDRKTCRAEKMVAAKQSPKLKAIS